MPVRHGKLAPDGHRRRDPVEAAGATTVDRALLVVAGVVVLGTIMSILDTTVVNVAIDTLAARFHTTLTTIQWVATGYTLALATVVPLTFGVGGSKSAMAWRRIGAPDPSPSQLL